jgi:hypothetical protein
MLAPAKRSRLELFQGNRRAAARRWARNGAHPRGAGKGPALPDKREPIVDLRGLEPPEPLVRILDAIAQADGPMRFLLSREPFPLYPMLRGSGFRHAVRRDERGIELTVERKERKP